MLPEPPDWQTRAACLHGDREVFFPDKGGSAIPAKRVCNGTDDRPPCDVRQECLDYALEHDIRWGVWGGMSERERERLRKRLGFPERPHTGLKPCGTDAAYTRHIRRREEVCGACREAHREARYAGRERAS